jgi:regulator of replication initiation timing
MTDDLKRIEEIENLFKWPGFFGSATAVVQELLPLARLAIEARAAESEVEAAARAIDGCPDNDVNEWAKRALAAAAAWRKAHEPKAEEIDVDALKSRLSELETDRDQHRRAAGTALDRNRDLLIENERLRVQVVGLDAAMSSGALREELSNEVIAKLRAQVKTLRVALAPFSVVAEHDIGLDAADSDIFLPMLQHNRAPRLRVSDFRCAHATYVATEEPSDGE